MWALKGQQPEIPFPGGRLRQPLIGAIDPHEGRVHVGLSKSLKAEQFIHFLTYLLRLYHERRKIIVVLDNARAHHAALVEEFLKTRGSKIELMFLPPYSPNLNVIERLWKKMRKEVTHNTFFENFKKFQRALITFFRKYKLPSKKIRKLCSYVGLLNSL